MLHFWTSYWKLHALMQVLHDTFFHYKMGVWSICVFNINELHGRNTIKNTFELYKDISEIAMFNV